MESLLSPGRRTSAFALEVPSDAPGTRPDVLTLTSMTHRVKAGDRIVTERSAGALGQL